MQFEKRFKPGIREGRITQSFRAWKRPQVKTGGRYRVHRVGMIQVDAIEHCRRAAISSADARKAGFESRDALLDYLDRKSHCKSVESQPLYRVVFHYAGSGEDERPDTSPVDAADLDALRSRLMRMDRLSSRGAWTRQTLDLIEALPATPLLVFADHGFRIAPDGRSYVHGGSSTLERTVPVLHLLPR